LEEEAKNRQTAEATKRAEESKANTSTNLAAADSRQAFSRPADPLAYGKCYGGIIGWAKKSTGGLIPNQRAVDFHKTWQPYAAQVAAAATKAGGCAGNFNDSELLQCYKKRLPDDRDATFQWAFNLGIETVMEAPGAAATEVPVVVDNRTVTIFRASTILAAEQQTQEGLVVCTTGFFGVASARSQMRFIITSSVATSFLRAHAFFSGFQRPPSPFNVSLSGNVFPDTRMQLSSSSKFSPLDVRILLLVSYGYWVSCCPGLFNFTLKLNSLLLRGRALVCLLFALVLLLFVLIASLVAMGKKGPIQFRNKIE
jgi:hypothetical protein